MRVIVGLGNPGCEYENTRHNIGFAVVDTLAADAGIAIREGKGEYLFGEKKVSGCKVMLVKPLTYMNNSGIVLKEIVDFFTLELRQLLVISDDLHLPLGTIRIRQRGGAGGHNGLYSIIYHLQSEEFPRMKCGIASDSTPSSKNQMADYVLSPFDAGEKDKVGLIIKRAADSAWKKLYEDPGTAGYGSVTIRI